MEVFLVPVCAGVHVCIGVHINCSGVVGYVRVTVFVCISPTHLGLLDVQRP